MAVLAQAATPAPPAAKPVVRDNNILLYGDTGDGKTALAGELAESIYKKEKKKARLYSMDRGGLRTIKPYIDLGIIEPEILGDGDPWIFLHNAVRGRVRDGAGKWQEGKRDDIGLYIFESMTSGADALMQSLALKAAAGVNIGGGGNVNFTITEEGQSLKVGGNNQSHYGVVQGRIVQEVWESQRLPGWLLWTASAKRDEDQNSSGRILGPQIAGKALTGEVPRWFVYTFRVAAIPAQGATAERHILYLGDHTDPNSGGSKGLGNTRVPMDAPKLPPSIEPASLVKAIEMINAGDAPAMEAIRRRIGL